MSVLYIFPIWPMLFHSSVWNRSDSMFFAPFYRWKIEMWFQYLGNTDWLNHLSLQQFENFSSYLIRQVSIYLSVYLCIYLSIYLSSIYHLSIIYLSIHLFTHPPSFHPQYLSTGQLSDSCNLLKDSHEPGGRKMFWHWLKYEPKTLELKHRLWNGNTKLFKSFLDFLCRTQRHF